MSADFGVLHSAGLWLELDGDDAIPEARKLVASMADRWLRIIVALEAMRQVSSNFLV